MLRRRESGRPRTRRPGIVRPDRPRAARAFVRRPAPPPAVRRPVGSDRQACRGISWRLPHRAAL